MVIQAILETLVRQDFGYLKLILFGDLFSFDPFKCELNYPDSSFKKDISYITEKIELYTEILKCFYIDNFVIDDYEQKDIKDQYNGLSYIIDLAKKFPEDIKWIKLKHNHRSDLVGKILEYEYSGK